jgi:hypothetical protein
MNRVSRVLTPTRTRLHSLAAAGAFAIIAGLSAPATAASISPSATHDDITTVAHTTTASTTHTATTTPATKTTANASTVNASTVNASTVNASTVNASTVKASTVKAVTKDAAKPGAPATKALHPVAVTADQANLTPTKDQINNSRAIIEAGQKMKLPPRAWVIAIATSMQESQLKNIGNLGDANDHDSLGLFQQRPSSGWGTPDQLTNPQYAATAFYKGLIDVKGYDKMPLTDAAQAVQVSAFPDHYAKWETVAGHLVEAYYGTGPYTNK